MRARKKKNTVPRLEKCASLLVDTITPAEGRVCLEVGCGKGKFIVGLAAAEPETNFYALEKVPDVAVMAVEKAATAELKNVKFIIGDAEKLKVCCPEGCVDILYLNFSDPWPRNRDIEKRLTYKSFLATYAKILKPDGYIFMKTDNPILFAFSKTELSDNGFGLFDVTEDLHNSDIENKVTTEYEERFTALGQPIYSLKARALRGKVSATSADTNILS